MNVFQRINDLPLGVDLGADEVSIVAARVDRAGFVVAEALTRPVAGTGADVDRAVGDALRELTGALHTKQRRCVIAAPQSEVVMRLFRLPSGMGRNEAERAASLEADALGVWPAAERLVALDPIPDLAGQMLLSIGRNSAIERRVAVARAAGLVPIAVDVPACAWQRALPGGEALLDLRGERAILIIFGRPLATAELLASKLADERLVTQVRSGLIQARRDGVADVQTLAVTGTRTRYEPIAALLRADGYAVEPVRLAGVEAPPWALAFGLASWAIAPRGLRAA